MQIANFCELVKRHSALVNRVLKRQILLAVKGLRNFFIHTLWVNSVQWFKRLNEGIGCPSGWYVVLGIRL